MALETVVAIARIAFGVLFLAKLYASLRARDLLWAHALPVGLPNHCALHFSLMLLFVLVSLFTVGLFTGPVSLAILVLYFILWQRISIYGLEDNIFQALALYFTLAGAGAAWSLDALMGTGAWGRFPEGSLIPELALAAIIGIIFLSAGVDKSLSPLWRRGMGVYYFFLMPIHRRGGTGFITSRKRLSMVMSCLAVIMQVGLLPAMLINSVPLGLSIWAMLLVFSVLLSTLFVFTWLGEALCLTLLIILWLLLHTGFGGLALAWRAELTRLNTPAEFAVAIMVVVSLIAALWSGVVPHLWPNLKHPPLAALNVAMRYVSRYVWGFLPVSLFSEQHIAGPVIYRSFVETGDGRWEETFRIFTRDALAGPERIWRPTFVEVTQYKVAEACMEIDAYGKVQTPERRQMMFKLAEHIARKARKGKELLRTRVRFKVLQLAPPEIWSGSDATWYSNQAWQDAFEVEIEAGRAKDLRVLNRPLLKAPTGRDISRLSFAFNPRKE